MKGKTVLRYTALIIMVAMIALCFAGCGSNVKAITAAADGMLSAIQSGDLEKVAEYASGEIISEGDLAMMDAMKTFSEDMIRELGASDETVSDEARKAIDDLGTTILTAYVKSYEIGEVQEEEDAGYVACNIVYGYDPEALENIDYTQEVTSMVQNYTNEHLSELVQILNEQGQEALAQKIINDIMPDLCDLISGLILSTGEKTEKAILKVENIDGKWLVTEAKLAGQE